MHAHFSLYLSHTHTHTLGEDSDHHDNHVSCALYSLRVRWCSAALPRERCLCGRTGVRIEIPWGCCTTGAARWRVAEGGQVGVWPWARGGTECSWVTVEPGSRSCTGKVVSSGSERTEGSVCVKEEGGYRNICIILPLNICPIITGTTSRLTNHSSITGVTDCVHQTGGLLIGSCYDLANGESTLNCESRKVKWHTWLWEHHNTERTWDKIQIV